MLQQLRSLTFVFIYIRFQIFGPGFFVNEEDEYEIFSVFSDKTKKMENIKNDGIKKFFSWLDLLSSVNLSENKNLMKKYFVSDDIIKPKDLLRAIYERYYFVILLFCFFIFNCLRNFISLIRPFY